jgi:hypothetical protein
VKKAVLSNYQGVAEITAAPTDGAAVLSANSKISSIFNGSTAFFTDGELGGSYASAGSASQTVTSTISESVDLTQLTSRGNLVMGLYGGAFTGTGFTSLTFNLTVDGVAVISNETFNTAASAKAYFTNDAFTLGSLVTGAYSGSTLDVVATMSVVGGSVGSGFDGEIIFGDAPAKAPSVSARAPMASPAVAAPAAHPATNRFVQAMAAFGASASSAAELTAPAQARSELLLGASLARRELTAQA